MARRAQGHQLAPLQHLRHVSEQMARGTQQPWCQYMDAASLQPDAWMGTTQLSPKHKGDGLSAPLRPETHPQLSPSPLRCFHPAVPQATSKPL